MNRFFIFLLIGIMSAGFLSCSDDDEIGQDKPTISFVNEEGIFTIKIGNTLVITPTVTNATDAYYSWKMDGKIVCQEAVYTFVAEKAGQYFLTFSVNASSGLVEKELRVDVLDMVPPQVKLPSVDGVISVITGKEITIEPEVTPRAGATYRWQFNREDVSTDSTYTFKQTTIGDYHIKLIVTNADGTGSDEAIIRVEEEPQPECSFENAEFTSPLGRDLVLAPYLSYVAEGITYQWHVNGTPMGTEEFLRYSPPATGIYEISVTGTSEKGTSTAIVSVTCTENPTDARPAGAKSSAYSNEVYDFLPAPGQFVNEGYNAQTQEEANAYAKRQLAAGSYISLGGFGGYVVVGFDHSIENKEGYDLAIKGNAFAGSSEPGIVWVMQDDNGNGKPDDVWYELKGSDTGNERTIQRYAITYFKPLGNRESVRWKDNQGKTGKISVNEFHMQKSYYPYWVTDASYTLYGTCLSLNNSYNPETGFWYNGGYAWGYVDNTGSDMDTGTKENHFDLDNAIYPDGTKVELQHIDFVKVQVGVNGSSGALGEISTEVLGFRDMHFGK